MRPSAFNFHQLIAKHFSSATINGKPWLHMYDDRGVQEHLLKFGPEMLNVIPALLTYAASKVKGLSVEEVEQGFDRLIADIRSTGHTIAAEGVRAWTEAMADSMRDGRVVEACVFPLVSAENDELRQRVIARLKAMVT